mgnify:CR=1 FL=1
MEKAKPLSDLSRNGQFHFQMGRNTLSNFYHNVLPQLQDIADITEENPEKFQEYGGLSGSPGRRIARKQKQAAKQSRLRPLANLFFPFGDA